METIARQQLADAARRAAGQGLQLRIEPGAAALLAQQCLRSDGGARTLRHRIQTQVEEAAAELLLRGGRCASVLPKDGKLAVEEIPNEDA